MPSPREKLGRGTGVVVRAMSSSDAPAAHCVLMESPEASIWSMESLTGLASQGMALVAELDGSVAGILIGRAAADEFEILNLAVGRAWRRRGAATHLVRAALDRALSAGTKQVYLEVRASNRSAIALYQSIGFREYGRRVGYYRDPVEDALLLVFHNSEQSL